MLLQTRLARARRDIIFGDGRGCEHAARFLVSQLCLLKLIAHARHLSSHFQTLPCRFPPSPTLACPLQVLAWISPLAG